MHKLLGTLQNDPIEPREERTVLRPVSNLFSSSGRTEESLSAYADQTLRFLAALDPSLDIIFLPAPDQVSQQDRT